MSAIDRRAQHGVVEITLRLIDRGLRGARDAPVIEHFLRHPDLRVLAHLEDPVRLLLFRPALAVAAIALMVSGFLYVGGVSPAIVVRPARSAPSGPV